MNDSLNLYDKFVEAEAVGEAVEAAALPPEETLSDEAAADFAARRSAGSWVMGLAFFSVIALFMIHLIRLKLLPTPIVAAVGGALLLLWLIVFLLSKYPAKKVRSIFSIVLTLAFSAVLIYGTTATAKILATFEKITNGGGTKTVQMEIYVRSEDTAAAPKDLAGYPIGLLTAIERQQAEDVLATIEQATGETAAVREFGSPVQLVSALALGEVDAIILNSSYLDIVFSEDNGLREDMIRSLYSRVIVVETTEAPATEAPSSAAPSETMPDARPDSYTLRSDGNSFIIYISGIDDRTGLVGHSLSDVNILAVVNPATRQVALISTPRDFYVHTSVSGDAYDKLTHAGLYGVEASVATLEMLYDIRIDYTFRVDFSGFIRIVDALGGVNVYSQYEFTSVSGYHYNQGMNELNGNQALQFVRERKALPGGDRMRGVNQMAVIRALAQKIVSTDILSRYSEVLDAVAGSFETTIPYELLSSLVRRQLSQGGAWNLVSYSANGSDAMNNSFTFPNTYAYVMIPDEETVAAAKQLMYDVFYKDTVAAPE